MANTESTLPSLVARHYFINDNEKGCPEGWGYRYAAHKYEQTTKAAKNVKSTQSNIEIKKRAPERKKEELHVLIYKIFEVLLFHRNG